MIFVNFYEFYEFLWILWSFMNLLGTFLYKIYYFDLNVSQKLLQLDEARLEF